MPTLSTPVVFILVIAICAIVGLCNGLVVSYLKGQPFIAVSYTHLDVYKRQPFGRQPVPELLL